MYRHGNYSVGRAAAFSPSPALDRSHRSPSPQAVRQQANAAAKERADEATAVAYRLDIADQNGPAIIEHLLGHARANPNIEQRHGNYTITHAWVPHLQEHRTIVSVQNPYDRTTSGFVWTPGTNVHSPANRQFRLNIQTEVNGTNFRRQGTRRGEVSYIAEALQTLMPRVDKEALGNLIQLSLQHHGVTVQDEKFSLRHDGNFFRLQAGQHTITWPVNGNYGVGSSISGPPSLGLRHDAQVMASFSNAELHAGTDLALQDEVFHLQQAGWSQGNEGLLALNKAKVFAHHREHMANLAQRDTNFPQYARRVEVIQPSPQARNTTGIFEGFVLPDRLRYGPEVGFSSHWMDYSNVTGRSERQGYQTTFIDFANMRAGGGCFGAHGNVQEEQMVRRCPQLASILARFNPADGSPGALHTRTTTPGRGNWRDGRYAHRDSANPLLFTNLQFTLTQNDQHAAAITQRQDYDARRAYRTVPDAPFVNVAAMAAPELLPEQRGVPYDMNVMSDMLENAFAAMKLIHENDQRAGQRSRVVTGLWGAGVFGHGEEMSIAIQYLAARLAGIEDIQFTGIDPARERELKEGVLGEVELAIQDAQEKYGSMVCAQDILDNLLANSQMAGWQTKPVRNQSAPRRGSGQRLPDGSVIFSR